MLRELTDVSPEAYASFADAKSEDRRRKAFEAQARQREARRRQRRIPVRGIVDGGAPAGLRRVRRRDGPAGPIRQMAARAQGRRPGGHDRVHARRARARMHKAAWTTSTGTSRARSRRGTMRPVRWCGRDSITPYYTLKETVAVAAD